MKTITTVAAQGEILIRRIGDVPAKRAKRSDCRPLELENGRYIIGHSETGHHHVLDREDGVDVQVLDRPPAGMRILYAILENPTKLEHLREHDTHETLELPPGEYEFRIAREFDPFEELVRQSQD